MSEMNVAMRLTLENLASGPLGAFADQIKALEPLVSSLNAKFATFGKAAKGMGEGAASAAGGTGKLETALTALAERLAGLETSLSASVDSFAQFGLNAREAAAGVTEAGAAIGVASARMDAAALSARAAKTEMNGFAGALKGMAEIWAAFKIDQGIKNTVHNASDYQQTLLRLQVRNIPEAERRAIIARSQAEARQNPLYSVNDTLKANLAALPGLPGNSAYSQHMRAALMPQALQVAAAAKYIGGDKASVEHRIQNIFSIIDAMGGASNINRAHAVMGSIAQAINGGGGKVNLQSMETYLRMRNRAATVTMPMPEFIKEMALLEEFKAAGGGGAGGNTRGATLLNAVQQMSYGGVMAKAGANLLAQMGLINPKDITPYGHSSTQAVLSPGALLDSAMAQNSTAEWLQQIMVPRMLNYTRQNWKTFGYKSGSPADLNNINEAANAISILAGYVSKMRVGGMTVGSGISMLGNPASAAAVNADAQQMTASKSEAKVNAEIMKTYAGNMQAFHKQVQSLSTALGLTVIPVLTKMARYLTEVVTWLGKFAQNHKVVALFTELGAALGGALLILKGFGALVGINVKVFASLKQLGVWAWDASKWVWAFGKSAIGAAKDLYVGLQEAMQIAGTTLGEVASVIVRRVFLPAYLLLHSATLDKGENQALKDNKTRAAALVAKGYTPWGAKLPAGQHWTPAGAKTGANYGVSPEESNFLDLLKRAAKTPIPGGSPLELGGISGVAGHAKKTPLTPQQLAAGWGLQDMHRVGGEANKSMAALQRPIIAARNAVAKYSSKSDPAQVWYQRASQLAASANPADQALAVHAQQIGDAITQKAALKAAKSHLADLQGHLAADTKLNAAQVTAGVLTPDQAQSKTLADQRAAAPGLLAAARAVQALTPAGTSAAIAIQTTITKLGQLGDGLTQFQQKIYNGVQGAFAGLFNGIMQGKLTFRQEMAKFVQGLANTFTSSLSQQLAQGLTRGLFGSSTPVGTGLRALGGVAPIGQALGSGLSSMFSGLMSQNNGTGAYATGGQAYNNPSAYTAGSAGVSTGGWGSAIGSLFGAILGGSFAAGADNIPNDMVANIHKGEMIIPAHGANAIRSGKLGGSSFNGDVNVVVQHNGSANVSTSNPSLAHQAFGQMVGEQVRQTILQEQRPGGLLNGGSAA